MAATRTGFDQVSGAAVGPEWLDERTFRVGTTEFVETYTRGSTAERFHIRKNREMVEAYLDRIRPFPGGAVVEVGIADGGSAALIELVLAPRKLVALELDAGPLPGLRDFIDRHGIGDRVRDRVRLGRAWRRHHAHTQQ